MQQEKTVAQSVRSEVLRNARTVLRIEETTQKIALDHNCHSDLLIRLALLRRLKETRQVAQL